MVAKVLEFPDEPRREALEETEILRRMEELEIERIKTGEIPLPSPEGGTNDQ